MSRATALNKELNILFPLLDHLYIFQNLEYVPVDFLKWFLKNPFRRNLQIKHQLKFTSKVIFLFLISKVLILTLAILIAIRLDNLWWIITLIPLLELFGPFFILISQWILWPLESYKKQQILSAARAKRGRLSDLKVIAINGSFAKTSTKEMLYTLLWKDFYVVKTPKSYNTLVSIARTILTELKPSTQIFIVEMDAYHPKDISQLCELAKPHLGLITTIAPQHLERFGSMEKLADTQFEIANSLTSDGKLFLNSSDEWTMKLQENHIVKKQFYGTRGTDDLSASHIEQTVDGLKFQLHHRSQTVTINLPLYGEHHVINFLAAAALALECGLSLKTIQERAKLVLPTEHRLEIKKQGSITIIDNTYNTNPSASQASLKLLKDYPGDQKILITPGLVELGDKADEENKEFARRAAEVADQFIVVGENAKKTLLEGLAEAKYPKDQTHVVSSIDEGLQKLSEIAKPEAVVLLENDLPDQYK